MPRLFKQLVYSPFEKTVVGKTLAISRQLSAIFPMTVLMTVVIFALALITEVAPAQTGYTGSPTAPTASAASFAGYSPLTGYAPPTGYTPPVTTSYSGGPEAAMQKVAWQPGNPTGPAPTAANMPGSSPAFPAGMERKVYYPAKVKAKDLAARFLSILPADQRNQTNWTSDESRNTLVLTAPSSVISAADQLIPRMDAGLQLVDGYVDVGLVPQPGSTASNLPPAAGSGKNTSAPQKVSQYYDPNENRYVRVAWQAENAILPPDPSEMNLASFGSSSPTLPGFDSVHRTPAAPTSGRHSSGAIIPTAGLATVPANGQSVPPQTAGGTAKTLDIAVYACPPNGIAAVETRLRSEFAKHPEITIATDAKAGKILVHTTREQQVRVAAFLATLGVHPQSASLEQYDSRTTDGTVRPVTGTNAALPPQAVKANDSTPNVYSPRIRKTQELEKLAVSLFGDRLVAISSPNSAADKLAQQAPVKSSWRFTRRKTDQEQTARTCDIQFDFLNQKILLAGDPNICSQMKQLFQAMDRQAPNDGNVRRFISIRRSDTRKIKEILDYYNMPGRQMPPSGARTIPSPIQPVGYDQTTSSVKQADYSLFQANRPETQPNTQKLSGTPKLSGTQISPLPKTNTSGSSSAASDNVRPIGTDFVGKKGDSPREYKPVPTTRGQNPSRNNTAGQNSTGIRQTAWQADGLAELGAGGGAPAAGLEGFDPQGPERGVVGIVPDYMPQVLPDLDVVIIDAPEAEYKRIENMIREIEELAKLAEPKIEIYNLKHVNCVMLQGILQQLHQEMFVTKQGRVIIFAMQNPNAILLVGWGQAFTSMKDLINVFDQPIQDANNIIRVVRLKYAAATEIALQLDAYFPYPQPVSGGMAPRIRVFPDSRTNSLVIHAAPNDMIQIQRILTELDVNQAAPRLRVKTFRLKNLLAEDLRKTISNAILPSVQGTQDNAAAKYPILEILSVDAQSKRLIESGIMTDVSITSDVHNNQLIVTAPEDCMDLIEKLIELLDVAPAKAQIKIFRIMFGDATQLSKTLQSLLPTGGGAMPTVPNAQGEESFVPVRFAIDTRTNCIIAAAAPKDLKIIEALILSLDRRDLLERKELVVPLRNVQALAIAKAIDDYLTRKQRLEIDSEAMSVYQMFESQVIVVPESITNSLIISATPRYLEEIRKLVESFDADPPQVVIQVLIAEVTLGDHEEFGIEAGLQDAVAFDRSLVTSTTNGVNSASGVPGFDMVGTNDMGKNMLSPADQSTVAGQVINSLGVGRTNSELNFGGLVLSASSRSVQVTLRALRQKNRLQILSRPQVTAMDNQQAFILVGQRVPRVDKANMTNYGITSSVTDANVGLILLVTPRVGKDGKIIMEIGAEKSSLAGDEDAIPIFSSGDEVIKSPSINTIQAMTAVSAMDGETVMIGGLITGSKSKVSRGVPWLSDIPCVGWLFRYDKEVEERTELLIVMTPRIIRNSDDIEKIKRVEASKMTWCLADAMAINGNMGLFDPLSGQNAKKKTTSLPFLEMDKMDEMSKSNEYSPEKDYPEKSSRSSQLPPEVPKDQTPYRVYPSNDKQIPNSPYMQPRNEAPLPENIYRKRSQTPVPSQLPSVQPAVPPQSNRTPYGKSNMTQNDPAMNNGFNGYNNGVSPQVAQAPMPRTQTIDLDALARNGYSGNTGGQNGNPAIRPTGYDQTPQANPVEPISIDTPATAPYYR